MEVGERVKLIATSDPHTDLKAGDLGTVISVDRLPERMGGNRQIWVKWDKGNTLALIEGEDRFEAVK